MGENDDVDVLGTQTLGLQSLVQEATPGRRPGIYEDIVMAHPQKRVSGISEGPLICVKGKSIGQNIQRGHILSSFTPDSEISGIVMSNLYPYPSRDRSARFLR